MSGKEEAIHRCQADDHPNLIPLPAANEQMATYWSLNSPGQALSDFEVEARTQVDTILEAEGKEPFWTEYNQTLQRQFPEAYNQPLGVVASIIGLREE